MQMTVQRGGDISILFRSDYWTNNVVFISCQNIKANNAPGLFAAAIIIFKTHDGKNKYFRAINGTGIVSKYQRL